MWPHAAVLVGAGVFGLVLAIAAATYHSWEQQQRNQYRREPLPLQPPPPRIVVLGPCGICQGDVNNVTGFQLSCYHYMHHTCAVAITRPSKGQKLHSAAFNWADVCKHCVISRINKDASMKPSKNEGLRNREPNRQICADCGRDFVDNEKTLDLGCNRHKVHTTCWDTMDASSFATCPMCMDEI